MQKLHLIGNIGKDAEIKDFNGSQFISFTVAVNNKFKDKDGNNVEQTNWYSILSRKGEGKLIDYLKKGTKVYVMGDLTIKMYKNDEGKYMNSLNVYSNYIELLGSKKQEETGAENPNQQNENGGFPENDPF